MKHEQRKINVKKIITIIFIIILIVWVVFSAKNNNEVCLVSNGSLYYEEVADGYVIRKEYVLQGENIDNGMDQILADGERAAKGERIFRYYSDKEDELLNKIDEIDVQINSIMEKSGAQIQSSDISGLVQQIEKNISSMYELNDIQKIEETKNKIETDITKKAALASGLIKNNDELTQLINSRNFLEQELENGSENVYAPSAGLLSYRIDDLEDTLVTDNFDYLSCDLLNNLELKTGAIIPLSKEKGKIVNNFQSYIAVAMSTENASNAKVGDSVKLRLSNLDVINANIVYTKDDGRNRIIVFEIESDIDELLQYRKISVDVIWWSYSGWKILNSAIVEDKDLTYVEMNKAAYTIKIPIKVLRQNEVYSIVENYSQEELTSMGFTEEQIENFGTLKMYDEVLLH